MYKVLCLVVVWLMCVSCLVHPPAMAKFTVCLSSRSLPRVGRRKQEILMLHSERSEMTKKEGQIKMTLALPAPLQCEAPVLPRRDAASGLLLSVTHLGVLLACSSPASASPSEDLATLDNDALLKMAPEVQGDSRLMAWRQEKEERRQALAREAAGQKPLPRPVQTGEEKSFLPPVTTTSSSPDAIRLAQHLKEIGAVMYGGYGCMHCYRQKQLLGAEVVNSLLTYVECGKNGANSKRELCKEKGVKGFPTWEIDGQMYPGEQSLSDLAKASKFELRTVENKQK